MKLAKKLFPLFNVLIHSASPHSWLVCIQKGEKIEKQCLPWRHPFPPPWSWLVCIQKSHRHLWWGLGWRMEDCESVILILVLIMMVFSFVLLSRSVFTNISVSVGDKSVTPDYFSTVLWIDFTNHMFFKKPHNINF